MCTVRLAAEVAKLVFAIALGISFVTQRSAFGQGFGGPPINRNLSSIPGVTGSPLPTPAAPFTPDVATSMEVTPEGEQPMPMMPGAPTVNLIPGEVFVFNAGVFARATAIGDSTRLNGASGGAFLPSAIPVEGDPFFGSDPRASIQGSGSTLELLGRVIVPSSDELLLNTRFVLNDASFGIDDEGSEDANVDIQQAFALYNGLLVGVTDTNVSDADALPEVIDTAGPNARVTVFEDGSGEGTPRISYFLLRPEGPGFALCASMENPRPEINEPSGPAAGDTFSTLARYPDFSLATRYGYGGNGGGTYYEDWHVQFGTLVRDLGLENDNGTFEQQETGWGVFLSSVYRFDVNRDTCQRDAVFGSIAYGEGIGRYIVDLQSQGDINNNDAVVDVAGNLQALPALAWYTAYQHNWTGHLRSTATYSQVFLDSIDTLTQTESPYRFGHYVQANLVYHTEFRVTTSDKPHYFFTGFEWLYGQRETLDGSTGDAHRIMWMVAFAN